MVEWEGNEEWVGKEVVKTYDSLVDRRGWRG